MDEPQSLLIERACNRLLLLAAEHADQQAGQVLGEFDDRITLTPEGWRIVSRQASFLLHG